MRKNKIIFFDFDGVVVSSGQLSFEINRELIVDLEYSEIQEWAEESVYGRKLREEVDVIEQDKYYFKQYGQRLMALEPVKGIETVLKKIKEMGYGIVMVSSSSEKTVEEFLEKYGLRKYFWDVLAKETHASKVEKFKMMLKKYKIDPSKTVMVTDTVGDIKEAREVNIKTIGTSWGVHEVERLKKNGIDFIAMQPKDIVAGIKKILVLN